MKKVLLLCLISSPAWAVEAPTPVQPLPSATITLTKDEAASLMQIIDIAVKAQGLQLAGPASYFADKINRAFKPVEPEKK